MATTSTSISGNRGQLGLDHQPARSTFTLMSDEALFLGNYNTPVATEVLNYTGCDNSSRSTANSRSDSSSSSAGSLDQSSMNGYLQASQFLERFTNTPTPNAPFPQQTGLWFSNELANSGGDNSSSQMSLLTADMLTTPATPLSGISSKSGHLSDLAEISTQDVGSSAYSKSTSTPVSLLTTDMLSTPTTALSETNSKPTQLYYLVQSGIPTRDLDPATATVHNDSSSPSVSLLTTAMLSTPTTEYSETNTPTSTAPPSDIIKIPDIGFAHSTPVTNRQMAFSVQEDSLASTISPSYSQQFVSYDSVRRHDGETDSTNDRHVSSGHQNSTHRAQRDINASQYDKSSTQSAHQAPREQGTMNTDNCQQEDNWKLKELQQLTSQPMWRHLQSALQQDCKDDSLSSAPLQKSSIENKPFQVPLSVRVSLLQLQFTKFSSKYKTKVEDIQFKYQLESARLEAQRYQDLLRAATTPWQIANINIDFDRRHATLIDSFERLMEQFTDSTEQEAPCSGKARKTKCISLNVTAVKIMERYYNRNKEHPYPSYSTAEALATAGGITVEQVKKWFANRRMRCRNTKQLADIAQRRKVTRDLADESLFIGHYSRV